MKIVLAVMTMFALAAAGDPLQSQWRVTLKFADTRDAFRVQGNGQNETVAGRE